jgi:hypothetical protein
MARNKQGASIRLWQSRYLKYPFTSFAQDAFGLFGGFCYTSLSQPAFL